MADGRARAAWTGRVVACALLLPALTWAYWPTLEQMARRWSQDPQYTHGYVVPFLAAVVLWFRRDRFPGCSTDGWAPWVGVASLMLAACLRIIGTLFAFEWVEAGSLLPALAGVVLLTLGPAVLCWAWPAVVFLLYVLPWPWQFDQLLTYPLRRVATVCSTFALQTLGVPALARGNIITVNELEVGVVEACSGLGMVMAFFALSTAVALVIRRPLRDRLVLFASAAPVGVLMNVLRVTLTVFAYRAAGAEVAQVWVHDLAGWLMMPLALAALWLELLWLDRLWIPAPPAPWRAAHRFPECRSEPRTAPCDAAASPLDEVKLARLDRPLQEIPDVAC